MNFRADRRESVVIAAGRSSRVCCRIPRTHRVLSPIPSFCFTIFCKNPRRGNFAHAWSLDAARSKLYHFVISAWKTAKISNYTRIDKKSNLIKVTPFVIICNFVAENFRVKTKILRAVNARENRICIALQWTVLWTRLNRARYVRRERRLFPWKRGEERRGSEISRESIEAKPRTRLFDNDDGRARAFPTIERSLAGLFWVCVKEPV